MYDHMPSFSYLGGKVMEKEYFDVVVIGAGPAGSVTARYAAEGGASVLILERDREPGIPVRCAEGVSHNGIAPFIDIDEKWIAAKITKAVLNSPDGNRALMLNNGLGYVLERKLFDTALCDLACKVGADLRTKADALDLIREDDKICGVKYKQFGEIKEVYCNVVIGADGVESRVGRWAGIKTQLDLADIEAGIQYTMNNINVDPEACEFFFGNEIVPGGYIWIFPKSDSTANVGLALAGSRITDKNAKYYLDKFVEEKFPEGKINYIVAGGVPTSATLKEIVKDNLMLVGDAARQVNPITGGGIVQAMIAARIAGNVAAEAIKSGKCDKKFLKKYSKEWNKKLGNNQLIIHKLKKRFLTMDDSRFNKIVDYCKNIPKDKFSLFELFKEAIKEDPKLVLQVANAMVVSKFK